MNAQQREAVELKIARRVVDDLLAAGYPLGVWDGEDLTLTLCRDADKIMAALRTTDEDDLVVYGKPDSDTRNRSFVKFTWGEEYDVINNYGMSVDPIMQPIADWIEEGCT